MKMYPSRDTFKLMQGHVTTNQPLTIAVRVREPRVYNNLA